MKRFFLRLIGFRDYVIIGETKIGRPFHCVVFAIDVADAAKEVTKFLKDNGEELNYLTSVNRF